MPVTVTKVVPRFVHHEILVEKLKAPKRSPWGTILREVREEQGISQRQLADLAQVNRNVLRRLEKDAGQSSIDVIERVAAVLGYGFDIFSVQKSVFDTGAAV